MVSKRKFVIPKKLAQCADLLYQIREKRYELGRQEKEYKEQEAALTEHLIAQLPKGEASGIAGQVCRVAVLEKVKGEIDKPEKLREFIYKNDRWDLVYALRLNDKSVREMWDAHKEVPGVSVVKFPFLSVNKV